MSTRSVHTARIAPKDHQPAGPLAPGPWPLDPSLVFLNHGSYGSVLRPVLQAQSAIRERMERDPVRFFKVDLEPLTDGVRERLGAFLNCRPADLALVANATVAICTILNAADLSPGDEVLVTDHEYTSVTNELARICARTGAKLVTATIPFPVRDSDEILARYLACVTPRTRLAIIPHITSATSLIFPAAAIVRALNELGIDSLVDGAHAPGQIPLDVGAMHATYYVGSGHKWLGAPKGTGFMHVRPDRQGRLRSLALSSRAHKVRPERPLFLRDFDYMGTNDYTPTLSLPSALEATGSLLPGGWPALMRANHDLIMRGRRVVSASLDIEPPTPEALVGTMATLPIPDPAPHLLDRPTAYDDALQDALYERHRIVAPIWRWGPQNRRVVRISAFLYNRVEQYEMLALALREELGREQSVRATA
ncbi:MAG: aminotransferase class V-fold PLP-dependent enzyme [Leptolyngbya sp. PLA1]|nr:aminotransferase class V-fold PLP-dependent enzyme [Leptolyngbya sp. PLA1]